MIESTYCHMIIYKLSETLTYILIFKLKTDGERDPGKAYMHTRTHAPPHARAHTHYIIVLFKIFNIHTIMVTDIISIINTRLFI